ncbi:MAG TPA: hypothetical protein VG078_00245 [Acidimicrobiales bacterium]|nr:hypothetical protein [Acidimicrobiales bacterium]
MSPVLTRPRSIQSLPALAGVLAWTILVLSPLLLVARLTAGPSFVSEVTVDNPLVYKVNVEVKPGDGGGWTGLGTVRRETSKTVEKVVDQGSTWTFRFTYGRQLGGEMTVNRSELRAAGWRVTVPPEVGDRLRQAGLRPSAP